MKFAGCDAFRVPECSGHELVQHGAGAFNWGRQEGAGGVDVRLLWIVLPYEHPVGINTPLHALVCIGPNDDESAVRGVIGDRAAWTWDGNEEQPTLDPSIACGPKDDNYWHGWLRAGELEPHE